MAELDHAYGFSPSAFDADTAMRGANFDIVQPGELFEITLYEPGHFFAGPVAIFDYRGLNLFLEFVAGPEGDAGKLQVDCSSGCGRGSLFDVFLQVHQPDDDSTDDADDRQYS